jgi:hypothetical protein
MSVPPGPAGGDRVGLVEEVEDAGPDLDAPVALAEAEVLEDGQVVEVPRGRAQVVGRHERTALAQAGDADAAQVEHLVPDVVTARP